MRGKRFNQSTGRLEGRDRRRPQVLREESREGDRRAQRQGRQDGERPREQSGIYNRGRCQKSLSKFHECSQMSANDL